MGGNVVVQGKSAVDRTRPVELLADESGSQIHIDHAHSKVHQGKHYTVSHYFAAVGAGSTALLRLLIGATYTAHSNIIVSCGASAKVEVLSGTTYSGNGTAVSAVNNNRTSSNTAEALAYHTPTVNVAGTVLLTELIPGGSGGNSQGSTQRASPEQFVFATSTDYLIRVTNNGTGAEPVGIVIYFYEV